MHVRFSSFMFFFEKQLRIIYEKERGEEAPTQLHPLGRKKLRERARVYNKKFIPITKRLLEGLHNGLGNPIYVQKRNPIKERIID